MRQRSKMPTLLLELALMLLIFSLCAGVCLRIFSSAKKNASDSANMSNAAAWAQSAAQAYKAAGGDSAEAAKILNAEITHSGFVLGLGSDWQATDVISAEFLLMLTADDGEASISVADHLQNALFSIEVKAVAYG